MQRAHVSLARVTSTKQELEWAPGSEPPHAQLQLDPLIPCVFHSTASTLKVGCAPSFLVSIVQCAGSSSSITPPCFTSTEQAACAHPYSPCYYFPSIRGSALLKTVHCVRWTDLFRWTSRHRQDMPKMRAAIPDGWQTWDTVLSSLHVSLFMLTGGVHFPWKSLCCASRITLDGGNTSVFIRPTSGLPAAPLLETCSEREICSCLREFCHSKF